MINGGAEMYHDNGFVQVATQSFESSGNRISVEIYEMSSVDGAAKIYDIKVSPGGEKVRIGDAASLSSYYLNFRQDRYLVTLVGLNDAAGTIGGLIEIAKAVSLKIN
jgi:hypothetical protein